MNRDGVNGKKGMDVRGGCQILARFGIWLGLVRKMEKE